MPTEDHTSSDRSHQGLPQEGVELSLDELARGLATGTLSRGKAIRWMGGALLGAALAFVPGVAWANDCRRLGRACRRDSQCCSRNCVRRGDDKVCGCPEGQTRCNDRCVNLNRNENHCGECFNRCAEEEECVRGMCQGGGGICATGGSCATGFPFPCQNTDGCFCTTTTEGTTFCAQSISCADPDPVGCTSSQDCPSGWVCSDTCCLGQGAICNPPCGMIVGGAASSADNQGMSGH
jgi:Stigma-specific protein, Stig1